LVENTLVSGRVVQLTRNSCGNDDDIRTRKGFLQTVILREVAGDILFSHQNDSSTQTGSSWTPTHRNRRDVGEIGGHSRGIDDIVERQLVHERADFQEKRKRLYPRLDVNSDVAKEIGGGGASAHT
jgi:hypothetical protein